MRSDYQIASYLFSSALADAISPIFNIFIPLFAVELGASALELGLVGGASYAVYSFMPFIMGRFSDRSGSRKFFILSSLLMLCAVSVLYSASTGPISIIVVRVFEGIGWAMLWPAMEAAITESTTRDSSSALAVFNYVWSGGAALGPAIGTLLVTTYSYRSAFLGCGLLFAIPALLNGAAFLKGRRVPSPSSNFDGSRSRQEGFPTLFSSARAMLVSRDGRRNFRVWTSFITMSLSAMASGILFTFFGPYATSLGVTVPVVGAVTTSFGVVRFAVYVALARGSLRQRLLVVENRSRNLVVLASLAALSTLLLLVRDPTAVFYFLSFTLFAAGFSLVYTLSQTTLIAETMPEQRGAGAGLFECSIGLGGMVGPIIAGSVSSSSLGLAFGVPVAGLAVTLGLLFVLSLASRGPKARAT